MRKLSARQKKMIDSEVGKGFYSVTQISGLQEKLEKVNDYETLWSDVERYFHDKEVQLKYGNKK